MCQAALAHKGLRNSWKNRELSKNTEEDAVASRRNQISKRKAHDECDPWPLPLRPGRWLPAQCRRDLGGRGRRAGEQQIFFLFPGPLPPGLHG